MNSKVSIQKCGAYEPDELYQALKTAALAAEFPAATGKTVLLKPNIVMDAAPERAVTTHPAFLAAVIGLVREWGASRILVGDSPGLQGPHFTARASTLGETAIKNGAEWVDFTKGTTELPCPEGKVQRRFTVTKVLQSVDWVISLPKLKNHQLMYFTGAMKNLFGLVPSVAKSPYHVRYPSQESFASMIVDLNVAVKPTFAFMDAIVSMEGPGPSAGDARHTGLVLASANLLAMDVAASSIVGYPPEMIPVSREALSRQLWLKDFAEIEYPLLKPEDVKVSDFVKIPFKRSGSQLVDFLLPRPLRKLTAGFTPKPEIDHAICVRCGDCTRICASDAMTLTENGSPQKESPQGSNPRHIEIDSRRCIRCYCCHEICPVKAIKVKKSAV